MLYLEIFYIGFYMFYQEKIKSRGNILFENMKEIIEYINKIRHPRIMFISYIVCVVSHRFVVVGDRTLQLL